MSLLQPREQSHEADLETAVSLSNSVGAVDKDSRRLQVLQPIIAYTISQLCIAAGHHRAGTGHEKQER